MKNNVAYRYTAIASTLMAFCEMRQIAEAVAAQLTKKVDFEVDVLNTRSDGFVLRKKKDTFVTETQIGEACCDAIKKMIKDEDGFESYMADQYDVSYNKSDVCDEMVESIFNIKSAGRMIYVEVDF